MSEVRLALLFAELEAEDESPIPSELASEEARPDPEIRRLEVEADRDKVSVDEDAPAWVDRIEPVARGMRLAGRS